MFVACGLGLGGRHCFYFFGGSEGSDNLSVWIFFL